MKRSGIVHHSTMILPYGMKNVLGKYKKCMYFSYLTRKLGARFKPQDPVPIAPSELIETGRAEGPQEAGMVLWFGLSRGLDRAHDREEQYRAHVEAMKAVSNSAARGLQRGFRASLLHLARGRSRTGYAGPPEVGRRCLTAAGTSPISNESEVYVRCSGGNLNDEATKAVIGRRSLLLAGTALPVLSVVSCGLQLQQAQGQPSSSQSTPATAGNAVRVVPSDTVDAIQAKLNSVPAGGTLEFPPNSAFNFNGQTVRGKSSITVRANGPVTINGAAGPGTAGAFDFGGMSSWTLRGRAPGQGFVFNNTLVNADGSKQGAVGHCVFNNVASNGLNGSAVRMTGASFLLVINNDFNGCQGNVLGQHDWDNIRLDGNHFTNCWQPVSIDQGTDRTRGRNIQFIRNIVSGERRAGFETGGDVSDGGPGQYFQNLLIDNNWFVDLGAFVPDGAGPLSIVARANAGTRVTNNFFRLGPVNAKAYSEAIEIYGPVEVSGNLIVDFAKPFAVYGNGWNIHDNTLVNCGDPPAGSGPGNRKLGARLTDPPQPARIAW